MEECKNCKSTETVKNGLVRQKQRYKCKSCGHNFVCGDERRKKSTELKRITSVLLYSLEKASFRFLANLFDVSPTTTYNWVRQTAESFDEPVIDENIKEIEIDEMWHFLQSKKTKNGLSRPWILTQGELWPGFVGGRNATTARKLSNKLSHLKDCTFYTDDWDAFTKVLPRDRHIIGKKHTISIEQDNSNTRHHLGRMTRRTKIVSRSEEMIYLSMTLWYALNTPEIFCDFQNIYISIYN